MFSWVLSTIAFLVLKIRKKNRSIKSLPYHQITFFEWDAKAYNIWATEYWIQTIHLLISWQLLICLGERKHARIGLHQGFLDEPGGRESLTRPKPFKLSQNSFFQALFPRVPGTLFLAFLGRPISWTALEGLIRPVRAL